MPTATFDAPKTEAELLQRARHLEGRSLDELCRLVEMPTYRVGATTKGRTGALLEVLLGARGGSRQVHDFPELRVELKTVPMTLQGRARESTYVCTVPLTEVDRVEWQDSWVRSKLSRVLWVPIVSDPSGLCVGRALLWSPTEEQEAILKLDFEHIVGQIALGRLEGLTALEGQFLQMRPKARDSSVRTQAYEREGTPTSTLPRGFYLRPVFTSSILQGVDFTGS